MEKNKKILQILIPFFITSTLSLTGCANENYQAHTGENDNNISNNVIVIETDESENNISNDVIPKENHDFTELDEKFERTGLYTDPILMNLHGNEVSVVWFTEEEGKDNRVLLYDLGTDRKPTRRVNADTTRLSCIRGGKNESDCDDASIKRAIFRHEARVSLYDDQNEVDYLVATDYNASDSFTIKREPNKGEAMKLLLTSDLQLKNMCAANFQKVYETIGPVDAVLANGDLVDVPDRAYDWFDSDNSFFKVMQGKAAHEINGISYNGAPIIQNAPIFAAIGNHDVMGAHYDNKPLSFQLNNPKPDDFNTTTWEEIFSLPTSKTGDERYYAFSFGDMRVIVLEVARVWRLPNIGLDGKYSEIPGADESQFGYGQFIFEPIKKGSAQYAFLEEELKSEAYRDAKYHVVMYHFDSHSLGGNAIPPYTDPVAKKTTSPLTGQTMTIYDYPIDEDYLLRDVEPLLEEHGVDLLFVSHSHLWNRFVTDGGMNILQSSNVGNSYDAFAEGTERTFAPSAFSSDDQYYAIRDEWNHENYVMSGDPGGLEPIYPNIAELPDGKPYLASNTITAFSVIDTGKGTIDSYYFDTEKPDSEVVLFDSFPIL